MTDSDFTRPSDVPFEHPTPLSFGAEGPSIRDDGNGNVADLTSESGEIVPITFLALRVVSILTVLSLYAFTAHVKNTFGEEGGLRVLLEGVGKGW
jgi:hypothetical protein